MSIDLRAAAAAYLQARRARGYRLRGHDRLIRSFLDGLAAQNRVTITRADVLAFATAPHGVGRAWQALRMSTIRAFAAYVHDLNQQSAEARFRMIAHTCDLTVSPGCRLPRLHDLRHTMAVNTLIDAHRQGADVDARIAALSTYLGHANPLDTYWYLSASSELMALVSDLTAAYRQGQRP